jgi:hypothetical protein
MNAPPWSPGALTAGTLACSPSYTAPEAQRDQHGDQKAFDAYGLGAVMSTFGFMSAVASDALVFDYSLTCACLIRSGRAWFGLT